MIMLCVGKVCLIVNKDQWRDFMVSQGMNEDTIDLMQEFIETSQEVNNSYPDELHTPKG